MHNEYNMNKNLFQIYQYSLCSYKIFDLYLHIDNGIAFGITIGALTAQSCDASWIPSSTSWNLTDASFKLMELDSLSVYWNHVKKDQLFGGLNLGDLAVRHRAWCTQ